MPHVLIIVEKAKQAQAMGAFISKQIKEMRGYSGELFGEKVVVFPLSGSILGVDTDIFDQFERDDVSRLPFLPPKKGFLRRVVLNTSRIKEKQEHIREHVPGWDTPLSIVRSFRKILKKFKFKYIILATEPDFEGVASGIDFLKYFQQTKTGIPIYAANVSNLSESHLQKEIEKIIKNRQSAYDWRTYYYIGAMTADINACIGINETRFLRKYTKSNITFGTQQTRLLEKIVKRTKEHRKHVPLKKYKLKAFTAIGEFVYVFSGEGGVKDFTSDKRLIEELLRIMEIKGNYLSITDVVEDKILKKCPTWADGAQIASIVSGKLKISIPKLMNKRDGILQILYEKGIMTYPRGPSITTMPISQYKKQYAIAKMLSSRYGASRLDYKIAKSYLWHNDISARTLVHPYTIASDEDIYDSLTSDEKIVYDEVAKIVLSAFYPENKQIRTTISADAGTHQFRCIHEYDVDIGWKELYAIKPKKNKLEYEIQRGDSIFVDQYKIEVFEEEPPKLYTENSLYLMMKSESIGAESTYASHIDNILDRGGVKRRFAKIENGKIVATNVGEALINMLPKESIDAIGFFEKNIAIPMLKKKLEPEIAMLRRNSLISRTYKLIYDAVKRGLQSKESKERDSLIVIYKDAQAHPISKKKRTNAVCPSCGAHIYRLPNGNYRCENNRPRKNKDGDYVNVGSCNVEIGGKYSLKEYVSGEVPEKKEILEALIRCERVVLRGEYVSRNGKKYFDDVAITFDEKKRWYHVDPIAWKKQ